MARLSIKLERVNAGLVNKYIVQQPQFRRVMREKLDKSTGDRSSVIATRHYRQAISNVVDTLLDGIDGAENTKHRLVFPSGRESGQNTYVDVDMPELKASTLRRKARAHRPGAGQMWRDRARGDRALAPAIYSAFARKAYTADVYQESGLTERAVVKGNEIVVGYQIDLFFEELGEPLDSMLRRALIEGDPEAGRYFGGRYLGEKLQLLPLLSNGWTHWKSLERVPARSFISEMAARMGQLMFQDLISQ